MGWIRDGKMQKDTTMQELLEGFGKESLKAIRATLKERAIGAESKKKKRFINKQIKEINKKLTILKRQGAADLLADICAEKAVNGKMMIETGVDILTNSLKRTEVEQVQEKEEKKKKKKKA